jgi:hypothetical protein
MVYHVSVGDILNYNGEEWRVYRTKGQVICAEAIKHPEDALQSLNTHDSKVKLALNYE